MELGDELGDGEISSIKVQEVRAMNMNQNQNIVITQSGLNLVKSMFKYVELMNILNKFSFDLVVSLFKAFEFYIFTVFYMFSNVDNQFRIFDDSFEDQIREVLECPPSSGKQA